MEHVYHFSNFLCAYLGPTKYAGFSSLDNSDMGCFGFYKVNCLCYSAHYMFHFQGFTTQRLLLYDA